MNVNLRRVLTSISIPLAFVAGVYVETHPYFGGSLLMLAAVVDLICYWAWVAPRDTT